MDHWTIRHRRSNNCLNIEFPYAANSPDVCWEHSEFSFRTRVLMAVGKHGKGLLQYALDKMCNQGERFYQLETVVIDSSDLDRNDILCLADLATPWSDRHIVASLRDVIICKTPEGALDGDCFPFKLSNISGSTFMYSFL